MKKGFRLILVICVIAVLLVCQNAAFIPQSQNYFYSHHLKSGLILRADIMLTCSLFIDDKSFDDNFLKLPASSSFETNLSAPKIMPVGIKRPSEALQIADIRRYIEIAIPHYFNGSKYKNISLNA